MLKQCCRNSLLLVVTLLFLATKSDGAPFDSKTREPLVITSNRMEAVKLSDQVTFTGNVSLKSENMTLTSDVMIVYYDPGSKDIREIEAHGNVVVRKEGRVALSNDALYSKAEETIVLTGNASILENENLIVGEKITLFMADDSSSIEGGGKVMFYKDEAQESRKRK
jgi:lipopolysaccharide export system protein LptA